jgi:hypothetical protein
MHTLVLAAVLFASRSLAAGPAVRPPARLEMGVGEERVILGPAAERATSDDPACVRVEALRGVGLRVRAIAPGRARLRVPAGGAGDGRLGRAVYARVLVNGRQALPAETGDTARMSDGFLHGPGIGPEPLPAPPDPVSGRAAEHLAPPLPIVRPHPAAVLPASAQPFSGAPPVAATALPRVFQPRLRSGSPRAVRPLAGTGAEESDGEGPATGSGSDSDSDSGADSEADADESSEP